MGNSPILKRPFIFHTLQSPNLSLPHAEHCRLQLHNKQMNKTLNFLQRIFSAI